MQDFRKLEVWHRAHLLTLEVYKATTSFPTEERYCLVSQLRRSTVSIPSNIAEGRGRNTDADFARFVTNALGSCSELDYQLLLAQELGYLDVDVSTRLQREVHEISKMLCGLHSRLRPKN
jgi:four helix bundle protein